MAGLPDKVKILSRPYYSHSGFRSAGSAKCVAVACPHTTVTAQQAEYAHRAGMSVRVA